MADVIVYGRTSGEEKKTGQDVRAQVAQVRHGVQARGHRVVGEFWDDGVSGDVLPWDRSGWRDAVQAVTDRGADGIAMKEATRFSRTHPGTSLALWDEWHANGGRALVLGQPDFSTVENPDPDGGMALRTRVLTRFIGFWGSWNELGQIRERTREVMDEITNNRRATKSGRPPGRPGKSMTEEELALVRGVLDGGTQRAAHEQLLTHRGYYKVSDEKARKRRYISRARMMDLARNEDAGQKQKPVRNPESSGEDSPGGIRPVAGRGSDGSGGPDRNGSDVGGGAVDE